MRQKRVSGYIVLFLFRRYGSSDIGNFCTAFPNDQGWRRRWPCGVLRVLCHDLLVYYLNVCRYRFGIQRKQIALMAKIHHFPGIIDQM
jgi:hypothetical protein